MANASTMMANATHWCVIDLTGTAESEGLRMGVLLLGTKEPCGLDQEHEAGQNDLQREHEVETMPPAPKGVTKP